MTTTATTTDIPAATGSRPLIARGLLRLTGTELRLFSRDVGTVFFALVFPTVLLLGMGLVIPGMRDPVEGMGPPWEGMQVIHLFTPALVSVAIATVALNTLPAYRAGYREQGVFRRRSSTPMRPSGILQAHLTISVISLLVAAPAAVLAAVVVFEVPLPQRPVVLAAAFLLGAGAMLGVGLIIGGLAPKANVASGIGMLVYFPMLFFAGLWTPGPLMPDTLQAIAGYTPLGAASQAMSQAWFGGGVPAQQLAVLAAYGVVTFLIGARTFRWS